VVIEAVHLQNRSNHWDITVHNHGLHHHHWGADLGAPATLLTLPGSTEAKDLNHKTLKPNPNKTPETQIG
jgi:hypothetical protein